MAQPTFSYSKEKPMIEKSKESREFYMAQTTVANLKEKSEDDCL